MRNAFADEITQLAAQNPKIVLLSGDIGNRLFDTFKQQFPDRFFNCGVAEANMIGVAAGLAEAGFRPVVYTIVPFLTTRCLEQIKIDLCYQNRPVVLVGVGGGLSYASLGATHHACEDIGILRILPNIQVASPGDPLEVRSLLSSALEQPGPVYLRIGKKGEPNLFPEQPTSTIGQAMPLNRGREMGGKMDRDRNNKDYINNVEQNRRVILLSMGNLLPLATELSNQLEAQSVQTAVTSFHTVKPLDHQYLLSVFNRYSLIVTLEEHYLHGGLFTALSEWYFLNQEEIKRSTTQIIPFAVPDRFLSRLGNQNQARESLGMTVEAMLVKLQKSMGALACEPSESD